LYDRLECCKDFILGGYKEVVELYMDYALPSGEALFLARERCSDRAMMRSTGKISVETVEAFVGHFVKRGSVIILPPVGSHADLSLIDGYEFIPVRLKLRNSCISTCIYNPSRKPPVYQLLAV
jgi:hypothetical protein